LKEVTVAQLVRFHLNQFPDQDSNPGSLKYKAGVLTTAQYQQITGNNRMSVGKGNEYHDVVTALLLSTSSSAMIISIIPKCYELYN
jgi:hypothetical protein